MDFVNFCGKKQSQVNCAMHCTLEHCQSKISQLRLFTVPDLIDRNGQRNLYRTPTSKSTLPKRENDQNTGHAAESRQLPLVLTNFSAPSRKKRDCKKSRAQQGGRANTWNVNMQWQHQRCWLKSRGRMEENVMTWTGICCLVSSVSHWHLDHTHTAGTQTGHSETRPQNILSVMLPSCRCSALPFVHIHGGEELVTITQDKILLV